LQTPHRRRRFGSNPFELGLFSFNVHNGMAKLTSEVWDNTWEHNVAAARLAEEAGLEFLLPLSRWQGMRGYPVETDDEGGSHETLTWASGILAATSRIAVFGTLSVAYVNPVFGAKQCVTAHHIGNGRFGLNVVSGSHPKDGPMFGVTPGHQDTDYDYTEEWVTIAKRAWTESAPFDFSGTYFNLKDVLIKPKPIGGQAPMLISAGHSHRGRGFALQHADALFTALTEMRNVPEELRATRAMSSDGEYVPIYGSSHLICRPTRKEAEEYYHHVVYDLGDWSEMDEVMERWLRGRTMAVADITRLKERLISGVGTFLVLGSYDDAVETYRQLHEAGLDGIAIGLFDYIGDMERIRDEVLPRMERLGLRAPVSVSAR
jgi:alkanesulfonate monooxygenase SsuD/methylene tetrahydromethanopterin reductase-like flavin-dependent oxidoreductase (luciferase family)